MLQLVSSKQLVMKPQEDQTLSGVITIANNSKDCFIPFKIKSTNPHLFTVEPNRGILSHKQTANIRISTVDTINHMMAKELSQKHKFLVEYVILDRQPRTIQESMAKIYGPTVQNFRVYINTDSVRSSKVSNSNILGHRESDVASNLSNKYSFHSAYNGLPPNSGRPSNGKGFFKSTNLSNQNRAGLSSLQSPDHHAPNALQQLKAEVDFLQQQRSQLLLGTAKKKPKSGGLFKKIGIFVIGLIVGNMGSKVIGFPEAEPQLYQQQSGFWTNNQTPQQVSGSWW